MTPQESSAAVMLLNAKYGSRQTELDETAVVMWARTLREATLEIWGDFCRSWDRHLALQSTRWPPAPIDFEDWHRSQDKGATEWQRREARRLQAEFASELEALPSASPVGRDVAALRQMHFGNKVPLS